MKLCKQGDTRQYALHREAFTLVQEVGTPPNTISESTSRIKTSNQNNQSVLSYSRHREFFEVTIHFQIAVVFRFCQCVITDSFQNCGLSIICCEIILGQIYIEVCEVSEKTE